MFRGAIDNFWELSDNRFQLSGWCYLKTGEEIHVPEKFIANNPEFNILSIKTCPRTDLNIPDEYQVGFSLVINGNIKLIDILFDRVKLFASFDSNEYKIEFYWQTLLQKNKLQFLESIFDLSTDEEVFQVQTLAQKRISLDVDKSRSFEVAAAINNLDAEGIKKAAEFLEFDSKLELIKQLDKSIVCWSELNGAKKQAAVITYANGSGAWFPYFYQHYSNLVGAESIYVITTTPESFKKYSLGGVISINGLPFDNNPRVELASKLTSGLLAYYKWVINCDVDEIIIPHPLSGLDFQQTLDSLQKDYTFSRGFDIVQTEGEKDFDFKKDVLTQRNWAILNSALCKPHITSIPLNYSPGYHFCQFPPFFEPKNSGFVTLHLKYACAKQLGKVNQIVKKTNYASNFTKNYANTSSEASMHPSLKPALNNERVFLSDNFVDNFESEFLSDVRLQNPTGFYIRDHFVKNYLVGF